VNEQKLFLQSVGIRRFNLAHLSFKQAQWSILWMTMLCYFFLYTGRQNYGFAIIPIREYFGFTALDTGIIGGGMLLFYGLGQIVNGNLGDKYSPRNLIIFGVISTILLNWLTSFAIGFWTMLIPWCLNGYAQSFVFAPGGKIITQWWPAKQRGRAFGWYLFSTGFSSVVAFAICLLFTTEHSWRWLFRTPVLFLLGSISLFYYFVYDKPAQLGFAAIEEKTRDRRLDGTSKARYLAAIKNLRFILACIATGFNSSARYGLIFWVPVIYLGENWKNSQLGVWIMLALPLGMALGCLFLGEFSDRWFRSDRLQPVILFMFMALLSLIAINQLSTEYKLSAMILLFCAGFFVYGPQTSLFALCPELLGTEVTSTGIGIMSAFSYFFAAISEAVIGYCVDLSQNLSVVYYIVASCCLACIICIVPIKYLEKKCAR